MKEYLKMEQNISWCMKVMFVYLKDKIKEYLKMEQKFENIKDSNPRPHNTQFLINTASSTAYYVFNLYSTESLYPTKT
jgi:septin family protein